MANAVDAPVLATLESVLLESALAPLGKTLGPVGSAVLQPFAEEIARQMGAAR
ncbi:MAG: hypothetical protein ACP5O6_06585 [Candidatus Baltobacteraceae bacterium]